MPVAKHFIPKLRQHPKGSVVVLDGKYFYCGPYGSAEAKDKYDRLVAEWLAGGRRTPIVSPPQGTSTISQLILRYWEFVEGYYVKDGRPTSEQDTIRQALRFVRRLYGNTAAFSFSPLALKAVRSAMIAHGWCRGYVNKQISRIKRMFAWAVEEELLPPDVPQALACVAGLRRSRMQIREAPRVSPVSPSLIEAIKPFVAAQVGAMIELQLLTGMRPGEACLMRACDIDMTGHIWVYRPQSHKTEHHGRTREIYLGPQAQGIVKPFLKLDTQAYLFSPRDAREERLKQLRAKRKSKVQPSQINRRKCNAKRVPGDFYDVAAYRRAIKYACERAFPLPEAFAPRPGETKRAWQDRLSDDEKAAIRNWRREHAWHPHQLRHNAATALRKQFGVELARIILGHATAFTTEIYAEADRQQAMEVIAKIG